MKTSFIVQTPMSPAKGTLGYLLATSVKVAKHDETYVSVAYMTIAGLRSLLAAFPAHSLQRSKWLIGLDDFITQPGALDVVLKLPGSDVKVVSYSGKGRRFHPKVYIFGKQSSLKNGMTVIGSANLTARGLAGNGEASTILHCESAADATKVHKLWSELWNQGHQPTLLELAAYKSKKSKKSKYDIAKKTKPSTPAVALPAAKGMEILASDDALLDPSIAVRCWIECGHVTAMGRELELKAEQGIFFGLSPTGEAAKKFQFTVSSGKQVQLRMKFQGNHMWRLQLTKDVPEVKTGLRPVNLDGSLARSPYVAIIDRTDNPDIYKLRFILLNSSEFKKIVKKSHKTGTYGKTTARQYGWC